MRSPTKSLAPFDIGQILYQVLLMSYKGISAILERSRWQGHILSP